MALDLIGYCAWSFTDLLSWLMDISKTLWFCFSYVDQNDNENGSLKRIPKASFSWYKQGLLPDGNDEKFVRA